MTCPRCHEHSTHPGEQLCHVCGDEVEGICYEKVAPAGDQPQAAAA